MVPVFVFGFMCGAVVLAWIYNRTGSILAVAVWHGLYNLTGGTAAATSGSGRHAVRTCVVATAIASLVIERRHHRLGRQSVLAPTHH